MPFDVHRVDPLSAWLAGGAGPIWGCYARCLVVRVHSNAVRIWIAFREGRMSNLLSGESAEDVMPRLRS
jgi:hypothetical protein